MKKLKVGVLDDYQNVAHDFTNWETLSENIELKGQSNNFDSGEYDRFYAVVGKCSSL